MIDATVLQRQKLMLELRDLVKPWTRHEKTLPGEDRAKAIGRELHTVGGEEIMQSAYYFVTSVNPAASVLSLLWHGIGKWEW